MVDATYGPVQLGPRYHLILQLSSPSGYRLLCDGGGGGAECALQLERERLPLRGLRADNPRQLRLRGGGIGGVLRKQQLHLRDVLQHHHERARLRREQRAADHRGGVSRHFGHAAVLSVHALHRHAAAQDDPAGGLGFHHHRGLQRAGQGHSSQHRPRRVAHLRAGSVRQGGGPAAGAQQPGTAGAVHAAGQAAVQAGGARDAPRQGPAGRQGERCGEGGEE
mmetsp:Transcript_4811/g.9817  ORF Transcript_4811/g.9817 Transcript_4811/m.9817 type:complete len:222 (+) Transcript_4811:359-1024(+)